MGKLRLNITMSLDGYVAGPNQSPEHGLGEGADSIHDWAINTKSFREMHGDTGGGETGIDNVVVGEMFQNVGAVIMGRNMFGGGGGPWGEDPWNGWWGDTPPFHMPVFVLTHYERQPLVLGDTTFTFVTNGTDAALKQARHAAGEQDVLIGGGASVANQYLVAGLMDEIDLHIAPLILGDGARLFSGVPNGSAAIEQVRAIEGNGVTHVKYRVKR